MTGKKLTFILLIIPFVCAPLLTNAALAPGQVPGAQDLGIQDSASIEEPDELLDIVANVVKWVYILFFIIAILFIIFAAFNFLMAKADPEKIKSARNQLIYAAVAIAIALLAFATLTIIANFLEGNESETPASPNYISV